MGKVDRYLSMVDDRDYFQIVNSQIPWNNLTKKQKLIVIKFRIKYAISNEYLPYIILNDEYLVWDRLIKKEAFGQRLKKNLEFKAVRDQLWTFRGGVEE